MKLALFLVSALAASILDLNPRSEVLPDLLAARRSVSEDVSSLTLLHFSDLHGDCENLQRIAQFNSEYGQWIDDAIHSGDAVICYYDNEYPWESVPEARSILNVIGNHDCWKGHKLWAESDRPYDATQEDAYKRFFVGQDKSRPFVAGWGVVQPEGVNKKGSDHYCACYYYKDYAKSGIRMIILDCMHWNAAQSSWFKAVLSEAAAKGLTVIGVQHYPSQSGLEVIQGPFSSLLEKIDYYDNPTGMQMERMPEEAFSIVDSFLDKGGRFTCWLSGHTHFDIIGRVAGHTRQIQIIVDKAGEWDGYMAEDRTRGSKNQDSFNLVTVNPSRHLVCIQRIGCQRNERMQKKQLFCFDYTTGEILVNGQ